MRSVARHTLLVLAIVNLGAAAPVLAGPSDGSQAHALIEADFESGRIDRESSLLQTFRYVFAPDRLDPRYAPTDHTPLRCLTPAIIELRDHRAELSETAIAEMEEYLAPKRARLLATYISPGGNFELVYSTSGGNAVSATDTSPPDGIPDFVERCAEYMDASWAMEITTIGFVAPVLPGDGTYDVSFQSMGAYGYTTISSGTTEIVLHNTFVGFPANTDPDGNALGAAKVTCAHEFKHASNFSANGWAGWEELNATWAEDIVYPDTNDYWNYVNNNGPNVLGQPWTSIEDGGEGSYEDCLWEHYLSNEYSNALIVEVAAQLDLGFNQKTAYENAQIAFGTSWDESYPRFLEWAWFTGTRAEPPFGFPDASNLKRMNLRASTSVYPYNTSDSVAKMAGHPRRFNQGAATGQPRVQFNGDDAHPAGKFTVSIIMEEPGGVFTIVRPALDVNNDLDYVVPEPFSNLLYTGVIVTNSKRTGATAVPYTLDVLDETIPTDVTLSGQAAAGRLTLDPASPNPFTTRTSVRFSAPRAEHATVRILDVQGRVVRTLVDGLVRAGTNELVWDGRDEAGRRLATGVYWARVQAGDTSVARKVTLLR